MASFFADLDSYAIWKAIAVVLTGAFAVLAAATETKDKIRGRLTKWGWIALIGRN